ncbi:MAG: PD40 domain-containing protein [Burkholderiaceae bacterium]|nr:PD40 domain-containing protein [Microbacteriaceae bacterium]
MPRLLAPGQHARLWRIAVPSGERTLLAESTATLFEAPNWTPDGLWLVVNADGLLFRVAADGGALEPIEAAGLPPVNNDHVLSPDGATIYASADDGHLYAVDLAAGRARRITENRESGFLHFLHGVSPDGQTLAFIGLAINGTTPGVGSVFTVPITGGPATRLTDDDAHNDGAEFTPDGESILVNSERASTRPGHAQLFRMPATGGAAEQLTTDDRVNWFPHPSPDGRLIAYVSFPPGTLGHPADVDDVRIRLLEVSSGAISDLVTVFGGQGTMNVASWAPDSRSLAYVDYPVTP